MLGHDEDVVLLSKYKQALEAISALWPEPPHCADIYQVGGINDGRMRAITAGAAIEIARKALGKPFTPHPDDRPDPEDAVCKHCRKVIKTVPKYYCPSSPNQTHEPEGGAWAK